MYYVLNPKSSRSTMRGIWGKMQRLWVHKYYMTMGLNEDQYPQRTKGLLSTSLQKTVQKERSLWWAKYKVKQSKWSCGSYSECGLSSFLVRRLFGFLFMCFFQNSLNTQTKTNKLHATCRECHSITPFFSRGKMVKICYFHHHKWHLCLQRTQTPLFGKGPVKGLWLAVLRGLLHLWGWPTMRACTSRTCQLTLLTVGGAGRVVNTWFHCCKAALPLELLQVTSVQCLTLVWQSWLLQKKSLGWKESPWHH